MPVWMNPAKMAAPVLTVWTLSPVLAPPATTILHAKHVSQEICILSVIFSVYVLGSLYRCYCYFHLIVDTLKKQSSWLSLLSSLLFWS